MMAIEKQFRRIGARARIRTAEQASQSENVVIDIGRDEDGEFFDLALPRERRPRLTVLDAQPKDRHLVLMSRNEDAKSKFLCGHDERHWFVAAVPERAGASTVRTAMDALKPRVVHAAERAAKVKPKQRNRRRNAAFLRQGEWFFLPAGDVVVDPMLVRYKEPMARTGGKPHVVDELTRTGGELVYVSVQHPNGLTPRQHEKLLSRNPEMRHLNWVAQRRNPTVLVRGRVRHADHKTIRLDGWHQVVMNTETQAHAMRHVAFID